MIIAELTLYYTKNGGYKNITELNGKIYSDNKFKDFFDRYEKTLKARNQSKIRFETFKAKLSPPPIRHSRDARSLETLDNGLLDVVGLKLFIVCLVIVKDPLHQRRLRGMPQRQWGRWFTCHCSFPALLKILRPPLRQVIRKHHPTSLPLHELDQSTYNEIERLQPFCHVGR